MNTKTRKRVYRKKKDPNSHLTTITFIVILISVLAAAMFYFFYYANEPAKPEKPAATKHIATPPAKKAVSSTPTFLNGTWVSRSDGRLLEIHGNRFTLELPSVSDHSITKGTIQISGNTATILYTETENQCSIHKGVYTFSISKGVLHFSVKQDICTGRKKIFSTSWDKF